MGAVSQADQSVRRNENSLCGIDQRDTAQPNVTAIGFQQSRDQSQ
jgi:hypothetical protein